MMRVCVFLSISSTIESLRINHKAADIPDSVEFDMVDTAQCTEEGRQTVRKYLEEANWKAAKHHICTEGFEEQVTNLAMGYGDVRDIGEWLDGNMGDSESFETNFGKGGGEHACSKHKLPKIFMPCCGHSGSTTLAMYMNHHEQLSWGIKKEHLFFQRWDPEKNASDPQYMKHFADMYKQEFPIECHQTGMDATIGSFDLPLDAIRAVKEILGPDLKIVWMMRHPAKWLNSMANDHAPGYHRAHQGCYADFVENWVSVFGTKNMKFISDENFFADYQSTLHDLWEFLEVDNHIPQAQLESHGRRRSSHLTEEQVMKYDSDDHHKECLKRLIKVTGWTPSWASQL
eukprot:gnl/MRDRNA2_/MRDRNA2_118357_c0_seq1.p1 gnl/MRDRNA2_/MRDRNA2_118357_c0~~gnl/MRDRNA2_/MRDRNA2_118357_c0_seq1.p1  ORF type:complete len:344 (-),score=41.16 gnl/MRDRNA2_/MRDRNA2_118357_c0_seq1:91-1122(-)